MILTLEGADVRNLKANNNFSISTLNNGICISQDLLFYISHRNALLLFLEQNDQITKETIFGGSV